MSSNSMDFAKMGAAFREAGVAVSDEVIAQAQAHWQSMPAELREDGWDDPTDFIYYALCHVNGSDSGTFQVVSGDMLCFYWEVEDPYSMFEDFLNGVNTIAKGAFSVTEIRQEMLDDSEAEELRNHLPRNMSEFMPPEALSDGEPQRVTFCLNGKPYEYQTVVLYDWFDNGLIGYINEILKEQGVDKRLYYHSSDLCSMFCCSEGWAKDFSAKTGSPLRCQ